MTDQADASLTMRDVRPFHGRVTVAESAVDEHERDSGIVVPVKSDEFTRGVLLEVNDDGPADAGPLEAGMVVYYRRGIRIGDVTVVELCDVLAYEQ